MSVDSLMLYLSSVYPSATQVLPLYLCKRYATEPVHPLEGCHVPTRTRERLVYEAVSADAGWCSCTADRTCRPGSGVPRRLLTTRMVAATRGQPGVRAPEARWCGRALVRMSVAVGRHGGVPHAAAEATEGRRARWRSACNVLCDCRALATVGARGGSHLGFAGRCWRGGYGNSGFIFPRHPTLRLGTQHDLLGDCLIV